MHLRRAWLPLIVLCLCALHAWMAASVSRTFSTTFDEIAHLTAGYAYWTQDDFRFQPENGNLPQRLAAFPLLLQDVVFPPASGENWRTANVWRVGHVFFHQSGNDLPAMLAAGRAMNAVLSGALCLAVFLWTRRLFGHRAALLALVFAVFCPALLAHGGLITSDTAAALGFTVATLAWWRFLHKISACHLLAAGLAAGFLALSKYSVVLFAPIAATLLLARLFRPAALPLVLGPTTIRFTGWKRFPVLAAASLAAVGLCVAVIWSAYGFRYSAAPPGAAPGSAFTQPWDHALLKNTGAEVSLSDTDRINPGPGPVQHAVAWARNHRLLPEAWLYGLTFVEIHSRGRLAYFAGEYRLTGWSSFFPTAFLVKTTPPALALIILGLIGGALTLAGRRRIWIYRLLPLLALLVVYVVFAITSRLNIGHRHLLPLYPALYMLASGGTLLLVRRHRVWLFVLAALGAWHIADSLRIRPDYLAYFNPIVGGPAKAHRLFVDSSLDWGQDLPRLKTWLDQHAGNDRVYLSYFGTGSPLHTGIIATRIGDSLFDHDPRPTIPKMEAGLYCISATMLRQVYSGMMHPWTNALESEFLRLASWLEYLRTLPPGAPPSLTDHSPLSAQETSRLLQRYEQLLFGRLCMALNNREPDDRVGYSILIFRLDASEALAISGAD